MAFELLPEVLLSALLALDTPGRMAGGFSVSRTVALLPGVLTAE